jgi:hypothetical protein
MMSGFVNSRRAKFSQHGFQPRAAGELGRIETDQLCGKIGVGSSKKLLF